MHSPEAKAKCFNDSNWEKNKNIVKNFLDISEKLLPSKIIFISSTSIYPENKNIYFSESDQPFPESAYAKQKLIAEQDIQNLQIKMILSYLY